MPLHLGRPRFLLLHQDNKISAFFLDARVMEPTLAGNLIKHEMGEFVARNGAGDWYRLAGGSTETV